MRSINTTATTPSSTPTRIEPTASHAATPVNSCIRDTGGGDDDADQCGGVLGEDRTHGRIRRLYRVREQVTIEAVCFGPQLPDRLRERDAFQDKGNGQHSVGERVVPALGLFASDELS